MVSKTGRNIIVSDLHAAGGDTNDLFLLHASDAFKRCIDAVVQDESELIFAGDILDVREASLHDITKAHPYLWSLLRRAILEGRWIYGNHDPDINLPMHYDIPELNARVIHGHIFDRWNSGPLKFIGDRLSTLAGYIEKTGIYFPYQLVRMFRSINWKRYAKMYLQEHNKTVLIAGHTHSPGSWWLDSTPLVAHNCGTWNGKGTWTYVERVGDFARVMRWAS